MATLDIGKCQAAGMASGEGRVVGSEGREEDLLVLRGCGKELRVYFQCV